MTTVLEEEAGRTAYTCTILYPTEQVRDTILKSGLQTGASELYDKLARFLASQRSE